MTNKMIRFWRQISFWNKIKGLTGAIGAGSVFGMWVAESAEEWRWLVGAATIIGIFIAQLIDDKNNDGEVDLFQKPPRKP